MPSTLKESPVGLVPTIICTVFTTKFAVTLCGAFMVIVVLAEPEFVTFPVQLLNAKPVFAVAVRGTTVPEA